MIRSIPFLYVLDQAVDQSSSRCPMLQEIYRPSLWRLSEALMFVASVGVVTLQLLAGFFFIENLLFDVVTSSSVVIFVIWFRSI